MKRSELEWKRLFTDQLQSGLSAAAYCREHKLCAKYFSLRRRQLGFDQDVKVVKPATEAFVEVTPTTSRPELIEIIQGSMHLRVPLSVSPEWLASLVTQLR